MNEGLDFRFRVKICVIDSGDAGIFHLGRSGRAITQVCQREISLAAITGSLFWQGAERMVPGLLFGPGGWMFG